MLKTIRIASVGPALCVQGGISRVIHLLKDHLPEQIDFRHLATFTRFVGDQGATDSDRGSRLGQACIYGVTALRVFALALGRRTVFHVHFAGRGSLLRKGLLCTGLRLLRCQYVVHSHVADVNLFSARVPSLLKRMILWGLGGAAYVIVLTKFWREYYSTLLVLPESRLLLLPNPANLPVTLPDRSQVAGLRLLFLGRIGVRKGAFDVIRALAGLSPDVQGKCQLTMAGDGDIEEARALAADLGCAGRVSLVGWVGGEEVDALLAESDVLLLPSHAEGMAMALVEAMSWELPVITTGVGGASEFLEHNHNCILVSPGDVDAISNALSVLANRPAFRLQLGRAARATVSQFSISHYATRLASVYGELAARLHGKAQPAEHAPSQPGDVPPSAIDRVIDPIP